MLLFKNNIRENSLKNHLLYLYTCISPTVQWSMILLLKYHVFVTPRFRHFGGNGTCSTWLVLLNSI